MAQQNYVLADALGAIFRAALNALLGAIKSRNSGASAPADPVQGMVYVKTVSSTIQEVYEHDGGAWVLKYVINPTTHEFRSVDGNRRQWGGAAAGSADALTITTTPAIAAYEDGQRFVLYTGAGANTGAMTLNVDSVGAKAIKINGADPAAGDVPANSLLVVQYRSNIFHVVGGALPRATTARHGNVLLADEAGFLAATAGTVPPSDVVKKHARERLYANRTYYIRTDGSDANTGLANTSGGAWLTLQKAWSVIQQTLDLNGFTVTVQIGDGTYPGALIASGACVGQTSHTSIVFQGNSGTPGNVIVSTTSTDAITVRRGAMLTLKDFEIRTTTSGVGLLVRDAASNVAISGLRFGVTAGRQIYAINGYINAIGDYSVVGGATSHIVLQHSARFIFDAITVTFSGTPAFSATVVVASLCATMDCQSLTVSGAATGKRFSVLVNAAIFYGTNAAGVNLFPGDVAGTTSLGGLYTA